MTFFIKSPKSVTIVHNGKTFTATSDHTRYDQILHALFIKDDELLEELISTPIVPEALSSFGSVKVYRGHITLNDQPVHSYLTEKILSTTDHEPLIKFLDNVSQNPSRRAAQDLYSWCEKAKLPITEDGHIIAYKYVRDDYLDSHSATMDNSVGKVVEMTRSLVDDDFRVSCSHGLHFCSLGYLRGHYGARLMLVKINPRDVVAFPDQYEFTKARCCRYEVVEEIDWSEAATYFDDVTGYYVPPRPLEIGDYAVHIDNPEICGEVTAWGIQSVEVKGCFYPRNKLKRATPPAQAQDEPRFYILDDDDDYVNFRNGDYYYQRDRAEALTYTFEEAQKHRISHSRGRELHIHNDDLDPNMKVLLDGGPTTLEEALEIVNDPNRYRDDTWTLTFNPDQAVTILARIEAIEKALGVPPRGTIENRLDTIDRELGLEIIQPLIARVTRAEAQLGL